MRAASGAIVLIPETTGGERTAAGRRDAGKDRLVVPCIGMAMAPWTCGGTGAVGAPARCPEPCSPEQTTCPLQGPDGGVRTLEQSGLKAVEDAMARLSDTEVAATAVVDATSWDVEDVRGRLSDTKVAATAVADATSWATGTTRATLMAPEAAEEPPEGCHPSDRSGEW